MKDELILSIGGRKYGGWKSIELVRSIDALSGGFTVTTAAKEDGSGPDFQFRAGAECVVSIDNEILITGYADQVSPNYDATSHSIDISGRDRAADLIDCSAIHKPGSWKNARIEDIAAELAKPFGITVTAKASTGDRLKKFALQQGETVQQALERMLRFRALLAVSTPDGNIEIIEPKQAGVDYRLDPARILKANGMHDVTGRFSQIIVKGQSSGDDETNGEAASKVRAEASDPAVSRSRPLLLIAEEQSTINALDKRAKWEASTRAGKAQGASYTMQGWRNAAGDLYAPNRIIQVTDKRLFIDGPMLVSAVTLSLGAGGRTSTIECSPPEAWSQLPIPEEAEASRVKKGAKK
jgi:prophage tail gpP-like protein